MTREVMMWRIVMCSSAIAIIALLPPAFAQDAPPAPPPVTSRLDPAPLNLNRFVPTAEERTVAFFSALFPDCSSKGEFVGRITTKPQRGAINLQQTNSFPFYGPNSLMVGCNTKKTPGIGIGYKSDDSYVGEDRASILLIFPDGTASQLNLLLLVR
jgi:hypothetical protein